MSCNKCNFSACSCISILIAVLFGVAIGILFFFDLIPAAIVTTWIAFGVAIFALAVLIIGVLFAAASSSGALIRCLCSNAVCLLVGIIGTLITTIIALSIDLATGVVGIALLFGVGAFFFLLTVIALIALILCIVCRLCSRDRDAA